MKRLLTLVLVIALLLPLLAHAQTRIDPTVNRNIHPAKSTANHPAIPGESMTTGLKTDAPYIPVLVNIDNVSGAWPQWGIADADIIYEMPIHGLSLTRLMALFAYEHPSAVGPVRSGRVMHAEMREEWGSAWVFFGVQTKEGSNVNTALRKWGARQLPINLIFDGTGNRYANFFKVNPSYKNPHNHSLDVTKVVAEVKANAFPQRPFLFADSLPEGGQPATVISLNYGTEGNSYTNSRFEYLPETNQYQRFRQNKPYDDANLPGIALTFSNVIVQWTTLKFNGAANAPLLTEVGEGNADIFMGGRYIAGYWVRDSLTSRTVFYDENGQEIELQRGKTFINITTDRSTQLIYE